MIHGLAFCCWRDRTVEIALHSTYLLRRLWQVKNGGSALLIMSVDAGSEDYVCLDAEYCSSLKTSWLP